MSQPLHLDLGHLDLGAFLEGKVFAFLLIFARLGAMILTMPGTGETFLPQRIRLQLALAISFILLPLLAPLLPAPPQQPWKVAELITLELGNGLFLGTILRLLLLSLETTGQLIAHQTGLANAQILNPTLASQGSLPGTLLSMIGLLVIFESGLLDMMLQSMVESYRLFKPGAFWLIGDMTQFFSHTLTTSFALALQLVAPFMILGVVFQIISGIMVKMIPQLQIFFITTPLQVLVGLSLFALTLGALVIYWGHGFEAGYTQLFEGG